MSQKGFVIGVDYGTDSARSIVVHAVNGLEISSTDRKTLSEEAWKKRVSRTGNRQIEINNNERSIT